MKLKQIPEDFRVEETTTVVPGDSGPFAFYLLKKKNWTTPDALNIIRRRWQTPYNRLSYGGLKDRHAETSQFLSIFHGPKRNLNHQGISLAYLGQLENPYSSGDIRSNHFTLTLRAMSEAAVKRSGEALYELKRVGVSNYFDDQRFGSVAPDGRFVAKEMVLGRFEQALKLALASPYEHDRAAMKREKALLREHWGDWHRCKTVLPKGHARSLVDYLVNHPDDYPGALARLKPELRGLYLSAWQSHLWNKMLAGWLREHVSAGNLFPMKLRMGPFPIPRSMPEAILADWKALELPLPSARLKPDPSAPWGAMLDEVMEEEGLKLEEMKLRGFRKPFFSKGNRAAAVIPAGLTSSSEADELNSGKEKLILRFELPRGSYATMIVKRLTQAREID
jgi:tRNA pseudouridine13 synthase